MIAMLFNIYGSPKLLFSCPEIPTVPDPRPLVGRPFSAAMSLHLRSPVGAGTLTHPHIVVHLRSPARYMVYFFATVRVSTIPPCMSRKSRS